MENEVLVHEDGKYTYFCRAGMHGFSISVSFGDNDLDAISVFLEISSHPKLWNRIKEAWSILRGHQTVMTLNASRKIADQIFEMIGSRIRDSLYGDKNVEQTNYSESD